ncbi:hypothetical protein [uncultured Pontibacter sp.]|uniref:hypothetical protein n=1 Tax=uncultured Pontibacter sp. TaxID=453356 RepID=UPI0026142C40|nr:hypothetical protein [uncultured Pontibacter sp.]
MNSYFCEYSDLVAVWPHPVLLKHEQGDVYLMISYQKAYIETKWFGHITADDVITAAKVYLELIRKTPHPKLLNDKSAATGDWEDANDWMEYEWLPQVMAAGLKCFAHVYSENLFSKLSARDLYLRVIPDLQMENFLQRNAAKSWLANCNIEINTIDSAL